MVVFIKLVYLLKERELIVFIRIKQNILNRLYMFRHKYCYNLLPFSTQNLLALLKLLSCCLNIISLPCKCLLVLLTIVHYFTFLFSTLTIL